MISEVRVVSIVALSLQVSSEIVGSHLFFSRFKLCAFLEVTNSVVKENEPQCQSKMQHTKAVD